MGRTKKVPNSLSHGGVSDDGVEQHMSSSFKHHAIFRAAHANSHTIIAITRLILSDVLLCIVALFKFRTWAKMEIWLNRAEWENWARSSQHTTAAALGSPYLARSEVGPGPFRNTRAIICVFTRFYERLYHHIFSPYLSPIIAIKLSPTFCSHEWYKGQISIKTLNFGLLTHLNLTIYYMWKHNIFVNRRSVITKQT